MIFILYIFLVGLYKLLTMYKLVFHAVFFFTSDKKGLTYHYYMSFSYTAITSLYSDRELRPFVCVPGNRHLVQD